MPSGPHEHYLLLLRNSPTLAPQLMRAALHVELPPYASARIESAELNDVQPAEYRAVLVVLLARNYKPVLGIVIEVQRSRNQRKRCSWPASAVNLRSRLRCPVCVVVVATRDSIARWAARPISIGFGNSLTPLVIGPSSVPRIVEQERASANPELALLSALAHGQSADVDVAVQIASAAMTAVMGLDRDRSVI